MIRSTVNITVILGIWAVLCLADAVTNAPRAYLVLWDKAVGTETGSYCMQFMSLTGDEEWGFPVMQHGADLDGDGTTELVCHAWSGSGYGHTFIIGGATGTVEFDYAWNDGIGAVPHAMFYFDANPEDGVSEVLVETSSRVFVISGGPPGAAAEPVRLSVPLPGAIAPNPSTGDLTVAFAMRGEGTVTIRIFDASGRLVQSVFHGIMHAGTQRVRWDGTSESGTRVAPGTYFARIEAEGQSTMEKVIVVR